MSHETLVVNSAYANAPGMEYYEVAWKDEDGKDYSFTFVQNQPGLLPTILAELAKSRKAAKKHMAQAAEAGDKFKEMLFNASQLAYKVTQNSLYGFCGVKEGMLPCRAIAMSVTTRGRQMIEQTQTMVEEQFPGSEVVYGDTDSVMVKFGKGKTLEECFELGHRAAKLITEAFPNPVELEMEKCYCPYVLVAKKHYAGLMYENPREAKYIDMKGIQAVRRDNCPLVKELSNRVLHLIMKERDLAAVREEVRQRVRDLLAGRIDSSKLLISKNLKKEYKQEAQPHLTVVRNMEARNPGSAPRPGDRVPYLYIKKPGQKTDSTCAEDPTYVAQANLPIDYMHYLEKQIEPALLALLDQVIPNAKVELFEDLKRVHINKQAGQHEMTKFFSFVPKKRKRDGTVERVEQQVPIVSSDEVEVDWS